MRADRFHKAGIKSKTNITLGVQRFKELIDATTNISTPITTVFVEPYLQQSKTSVLRLAASLVAFELSDIVLQGAVVQAVGPQTDETDDETIMRRLHGKAPPSCYLRMELDKKTIVSKYHSDVAQIGIDICIRTQGVAHVIWTTTNQRKWWIHAWVNEQQHASTTQTLTQSSAESQLLYKRSTEHLRGTLLRMRVGGIPGITAAEVQWRRLTNIQENGCLTHGGEYVITASGVNMDAIVTVAGVDRVRTFSNDLHEMTRVFGIEAGVVTLQHEMATVLQIDGNYINFRHLSLLCGTIAQYGWMCPVSVSYTHLTLPTKA